LLKTEFGRFGPTKHLLLRYTQALITQMARTVVCNRYHSVEQQLCRCRLLSLDRLQTNEFSMTQELIANMLGVCREGVTEATGREADVGLISYRRGRITVLDRAGLEGRSASAMFARPLASATGPLCAIPHRRREYRWRKSNPFAQE